MCIVHDGIRTDFARAVAGRQSIAPIEILRCTEVFRKPPDFIEYAAMEQRCRHYRMCGALPMRQRTDRPLERTGCGKSQVARWIVRRASARGLRVAAIRHPMPYGDLAKQAVQRFATRADLAAVLALRFP